MVQAHPKSVWHLTRGGEGPCAVSDQELLLLAELGHLRADDLLGRPGFGGQRTVRSLLGRATAPPSPSSISLSERPKRTGIAKAATPLLSRHQKKPLIEATAASLKLHGIARNLAGLLVAVVLIVVLGIALHKSFAIDPQPSLGCSAPTECHSAATEPYPASIEPHSASIEPQQPHFESSGANAIKPSESISHAELEGDVIVRTVKVLSVEMPQPSDAPALVPQPASEGPSNIIPLPTKKPARSIESPNTNQGERARMAVQGQMFKAATGFESFGFNNSQN
jgi:hypothetical protein